MTEIPVGTGIHLPGRAVWVEYKRLEDGGEAVRVEINRTAGMDVEDQEIREAFKLAASILGVKFP